MSSQSSSGSIAVWDPFVRVAHWLVVGAFFAAYFTEDELLSIHVWAGYLVGAIVLGRIVWGFVGTTHARFRDFLYSPRSALSYLGKLVRGGGRRYLGHSPAGGVMVILLLLGLAGTVWSGLIVYAYDQQGGPLASLIAPSDTVGRPEGEEEERQARIAAGGALEAREEYWEETHELFVNLTLVLIALHIGGVLLASFVHKENLVAAMFTGKKRKLDEHI